MSRVSKIEVLNPKKNSPDWELLFESNNEKINRLIELYKENPRHARIIYKQGNAREFKRVRIIAYTYQNGDINIVQFSNSFGISVTNKMYQSEKNIASIIYKKETNKWYYKSKSGIRLLNYNIILNFMSYNTTFIFNLETKEIKRYIIKLLPWVRNLQEDEHRFSHDVSFNTIITKKLFNLKSIYRHVFGVPIPVIEMIVKHNDSRTEAPVYFIKRWKEIKKVLINIENLKIELFCYDGFIDACKMADTLNKKINCSWGLNRLKQEHDAWSREISNVLLLNQKNTKMDIYHIYEDFSNYSGYELLRTNYDMVHDGLMMNHCVGTYIDSVNSGRCGIYKVDGYTLELYFNSTHEFDGETKLRIRQIKGYKNCNPPDELFEKISDKINDFNVFELPKIHIKRKKEKVEDIYVSDLGYLPF